MNTYKNCVRNTLIALLGCAMLFVACEKEEEKESKSSACEIVSFSVNSVAWDVGDSTITYIYPSDTMETSLTPTITLSPGATVSPLSGVAQNFFATGGVKYTVTAEDGVTTKTYIAKATRTSSTACDIVSFSVDGVAWNVGDSTITHIYPSETDATDLTPTITLSPGATVNPLSGVAQNFFATDGVRYTVTAEDGVTTKTYTVKASIEAIASGTTGDCTWTLTGVAGNYTLTVSGNGAMDDYNQNDPLLPWNQYSSDITTAVIQDGVVNIGTSAFLYCDKLTSVSIGNSVTSIGDYAFGDCSSLTSVTIPNSVTSIGDYAFGFCSGLTSVSIGNSVTSIGTAFRYCSSLTSVTIPNSVTSIGEDAFSGCSDLTAINVNADNPNYASENGVLFNRDKTTLLRYPEGKTGSYVIPNSVTSIGVVAFEKCSGLTSVTISNSVTEIGSYTFRGCIGLTSVTIPNSVTSIGYQAFYFCPLTSVTIPNSVTSIGDQAFVHCRSLTSITIPNSVISIGIGAFEDCWGLTSVTIPNSVTSIGEAAFFDCSGLTSVSIGNSVTSIGNNVFSYCGNLTEITNLNPIPQNIDGYVFNDVNKSAITLRVPSGSVDAYKEAAVWSDFGNIVGI